MPVNVFDQTNSGSSCYLLISERDEDNPFKQSWISVNERRSSFKQTANNQRRFDKRWRLMTGYGNIANTKQDGSWVKYVFSLMPEKKIIKLCSASRMVLQNRSPKYWRTIRNGFLRNTFRKRTSQKSLKIYFRSKRFRTIFEKRTPDYSLAAPLLGLAKSIYYIYKKRF